MNTRQARKILQAVALKNGVSVEEVRQEIENAIAEAQNSQDPEVIAYWKAFPSRGEFPTPEEVIIHVSKQVQDDINPPAPTLKFIH